MNIISLKIMLYFFVYDNWNPNQSNVTEHQEVFAGKGFNTESVRVPIRKNDNNDFDFIDKLPPWEIINKYNLKSKYFDTDPYAGSNRIKVQVEPKYNSSTNHFDNIMAVFVDPDVQNTFISGQLISFQELTKSTDPNTSGATSTAETGITGTTNDTVYVPYLNLNYTPQQDDNLTQLLVRDTDGTIKYKDSTTLVDVSPWTASTGTNSAVLIGSGSIATDCSANPLATAGMQMDPIFAPTSTSVSILLRPRSRNASSSF